MAQSSAVAEDNRLDFLPLKSFLPFEWRCLGQAFSQDSSSGSAGPSSAAASLSGRATFVVRQGYDPLDQSSTGRVLEGDGDLGVALRFKKLALSLSSSNLALRAGLDDPLTGSSAAAIGTAPSLKATLAHEFSTDSFVAASYDLKLRKPELSLCWTGATMTDKATLCTSVDPVHRTMKLAGAVSFPGLEWRDTVYDEDRDVLEYPRDDGARNRMWFRHEARYRDLLHHTAVGATLDLGRTINWVCSQVDYKLESKFPALFWSIPFSQNLYNLLVPAEDEDQYHHRIRGWDLDTSYEFGRRGPQVALVKNLKHASLRASWDTHSQEAGLEYGLKGLRLGAKLGRDGAVWKQPALYLHIEPLSLL